MLCLQSWVGSCPCKRILTESSLACRDQQPQPPATEQQVGLGVHTPAYMLGEPARDTLSPNPITIQLQKHQGGMGPMDDATCRKGLATATFSRTHQHHTEDTAHLLVSSSGKASIPFSHCLSLPSRDFSWLPDSNFNRLVRPPCPTGDDTDVSWRVNRNAKTLTRNDRHTQLYCRFLPLGCRPHTQTSSKLTKNQFSIVGLAVFFLLGALKKISSRQKI